MRDKTENIVVFSDLENVYQLNSYGVLEYKYLPAEQKTDLIDAKSSFIHALSFIELRKSLVGDADIMLKDIKQEGHTFVFTFGYRAWGLISIFQMLKTITICLRPLSGSRLLREGSGCTWS